MRISRAFSTQPGSKRSIFRSAKLGMPHEAALLAFPIAFFFRSPLVVGLLALGEADLELSPALAPVHGGGDEGVALAFHGADEPRQFLPMQQQLAGAGGVRVDVGGGGHERGDEGAD